MSLFKKPKKTMQRRVFSAMDEEQEDKIEVDEMPQQVKDKKREKTTEKEKKPSKSSLLLSFGDEDEDSEVFQVKKSSHSKKIIKKLDKERKKKTHHNSASSLATDRVDKESNFNNNFNSNSDNSVKKENTDKKSHLIQKEIRTGDLVLVVKNSEPSNLVLNGRAALCAGRDDMSSEEEESPIEKKRSGNHKFSQPANLSFALESGAIPDAAMIHEARKRRQKAREQGDFIPVEEPEDPKKGKRHVREEDAEEGGTDEDEDRIDMVNVTGVKEREERREKFYSVQDIASDDSDMEINEWENQQIRKGVTGAQLITAQQESIYSQYMIQPFSFSSNSNGNKPPLTTAELLEQAYSHINYEVTKHEKKQKVQESKATGLRTPQEILQALQDKLKTSKELNSKHFDEIERIATEMTSIKLDLSECVSNAPIAAVKYRFYQELKHYMVDLVECLDEKTPDINALEDKALALMGKNSKRLIERRRQDVRDQAKEVMDIKTSKKSADDEERVRRAAEREGRRTRRRRDREKFNMSEAHYDGMSSDDEVPDLELQQYKAQIIQIKNEATLLFEDVEEDYCEISHIKKRFESWKQKELNSYKEAFVNLCLPKIFGVVIRAKMILWNPFDDNYEDVEKTGWFHELAMYGKQEAESEESLRTDPDLFLVPSVIEKILLPKLTKLIEEMWDPLSTTQTLKLVGLVNRLSAEFPSLRITSKSLHVLFSAMLDKMKMALDNDVFIPIFQKQTQDAKSAFFQRQFYSGVKLFRNFLSFQGIISDTALKDLAISSLLNRYLLSGMRVSTPCDGISKAHTIVYTLPRVWFSSDRKILDSMEMFIMYVKSLDGQLDKKNPLHLDSIEKIKQIMSNLQPILRAN